MTESRFIAKVHRRLPKEIFRQKMMGQGSRGVPDYYYEAEGGRWLWIEYKYGRNTPSPLQWRWIHRAWKNGIPCWIVTGKEDDTVRIKTDTEILDLTLDGYVRHLIDTLLK